MSQPQPWYPPPSSQKSDTTLILVIVLVVVVVVSVVGAITVYSFANFARNTATLRLPRTVSLVSGTVTVPAQRYNSYYFTVPAGATSITVTGSFSVSGGGQIQVLLMDQANFNNWNNKLQYTSYYNSGQAASGSIALSIPSSGSYDLVYSNMFSTDESVQTVAFLTWRT